MAARSSFPRYFTPWLLALLLAMPAVAAGESLNGFLLQPSRVPIEEILRGGPPRDGIPALDHPSMLAADAADFRDDEWVIGIEWEGEARAYPIQILVWHELVNDTIASRPILVSYCPLCGTGMVFERPGSESMRGEAIRFGVSGLLYQSDMLMYDQASESLWSQILATAITGQRMGQRLEVLRSTQESWGDWRSAHPDTKVLSRDTGYKRAYGRQPYGNYATTRKLLFPVRQDRRYHPKMRTIGLRLKSGEARAYPAAELERRSESLVENFEGHPVRISYDVDRKRFEVEASPEIEVVEAYWFAWVAFHPETTVYEAER
jgi:hypothetical protein